MDYRFDQKVAKEDYLAFVTNHIKSSFFKPFNLVLFVVSIGYLSISPFVLGTADFTFLYIAVGIIVLLLGMVFFVRRRAEKEYDAKPDSFNMTYEVNDEGLKYITKDGELEKKWIDFYSAKETELYIYLYINKNSGLVFIKEQMQSEAVALVLGKIRNHIPAQRAKLLK